MPEEVRHAQEARDNHFQNSKSKKFGKDQHEAEVRNPRTDSAADFEHIKKTFQKMCGHKKISKTGTNQFVKRETCMECGKVLLEEPTQAARDFEKQNHKSGKATSSAANCTTFRDFEKQNHKSESEIRRRYEAMRKMMEASSEEEEASTRGGNRK
jgi:ferredoxin-like protein FixX